MILFYNEQTPVLHAAYSEEQLALGKVMTRKEVFDGEPLPNVEAIFSTWGMPVMTEEEIEYYFPNLKAVFYAAGTVQAFARPFLTRGIKVFSAWAANAVPVAEFTLSQILLANKGYFQLVDRYRKDGFESCVAYARQFEGNFHNKVGLIGAGMVGRKVIELLKPFDLDILVFDPFLPEKKAEEMGVAKTDLPTLFKECPVISNHLANNPQTVGMLDYSLFSLMSPYAVFINTGRNAQIVDEDLVRAMKEEPGRTALLDVTDPEEPLGPEHPFWTCSNILITPHQAGSQKREIRRMGEYMLEEYHRWKCGEENRYEVTEKMLATMA